MTLFESLKSIPKVDMHINFFGSIPKDTLYKLTKSDTTREKLDDIVDFDSLKDYDNIKNLTKSLLNSYENIEIALNDLIEKLKNDNILYGELFLNLNLFLNSLDKNKILELFFNNIKEKDIKLNIVLEIESSISKEDMYESLNLLYEYYNKGINGVYFRKNKLEVYETYKSLFDKFIKDDIKYIVLLDTPITIQNKEIFNNAKRIIYNIMIEPDITFLNFVKEKNIILEFPITYQNYFHIYDTLENHFVYNLFKESTLLTFTTIDMTSLDTDLLNEYCKLFNAFPFNLHDLVIITINLLNNINVSSDIKNKLIDEFKEKANELL